MEKIREQIKQNTLDHAYLLYGTEQKVVKIYRNKLLTALMGTDSLEILKQDLNFSYFSGSTVDLDEVATMASSYPFLGEKRVILVENSKAFSKECNVLADCIRNLPETTYIIFVENTITDRKKPKKKEADPENTDSGSDKTDLDSENADSGSDKEDSDSGKKVLYKAIKEVGHIAKIDAQPREFVENWVIRTVSESGKKISKAAFDILLERTGLDLMRIENELDKRIAYKGDDTDIMADDVIALVTEDPKDQVFKMIEAMAERNTGLAMHYYLDLLELKCSPQRVLSLIERQMRILIQVKDLRDKGFTSDFIRENVKEIKEIKKDYKTKKYIVDKYLKQASKFSQKDISDCLTDCVDLNLKSRTGALTDRMAAELIIVKYSQ